MLTIWEYRSLFLQGFLTTVQVTVLATGLMLVISLVVGLARTIGPTPVGWLAVVYVEFFRGTSLYVQLFWLYFALPLLGVRLDAMVVAVVGLALCVGAYGSEVFRAAILSVRKDLIEAGIALNMTRWQRMVIIVAPQALRASIPPLGNLCIELLKGTSLVALITVPELTFQAKLVTARTLDTLPAFGVILIAYFILAQIISRIFKWLELQFAFDRAQGR
jgi:polar amino acid transport system permease protein